MKLTETEESARVTYDYINNIFYSIKVPDGVKMDVFTLTNFKKAGAGFGFAKNFLAKRIQSFKAIACGESDVSAEAASKNPNKFNVI